MAEILFINTGGTIDADAYPDPSRPPEFASYRQASILERFVKDGRLGVRAEYVEYSRRDSKNIMPEDVLAIGKIIIDSAERLVIIAHGTDLMPKNARLLAEFLEKNDKLNTRIVVLTGAMMPLHNGLMSDGYANLEFSARHIGEFAPGVHVVMHCKRFDIKGLSKNFYKMRMENQLQYPEDN